MGNAISNFGNVPQSFEVLEDDATSPNQGLPPFTLSNNLSNPTVDRSYGTTFSSGNTPFSASDWTSFIYFDPNLGASVGPPSANSNPNITTAVSKGYRSLAAEQNTSSSSTAGSLSTSNLSNPFVLDGRYMRAFNGPGLTRLDSSSTTIYPYNYAAYANFRLSGLNPDSIGMDEDYDACDLENWYLAIQSADGQVVIPSFHRPGVLTAADWTVPAVDSTTGSFINLAQRSKILRPRQADNSPLFPADPSILDTNGKLTYDVDNDGDGVTGLDMARPRLPGPA